MARTCHMKKLIFLFTLLATLQVFAQPPVLRTYFTTNSGTIVSNAVKVISTNVTQGIIAVSNSYNGTFVGNANGATNLNASNLATGTVGKDRLPSSMNATAFPAGATFTNTVNFYGSTNSGVPIAAFYGTNTANSTLHIARVAGLNRVGIGAASTSYELDVYGDMRLRGSQGVVATPYFFGSNGMYKTSTSAGWLSMGDLASYVPVWVYGAGNGTSYTNGAHTFYTDNVLRASITNAGLNVVQTLTASNVVTSARWVDGQTTIFWGTGSTVGNQVTNSVNIVEVGDGTLAMTMSQTNGSERLGFITELLHGVASTNTGISIATLYCEPHLRVRSLTNAVAPNTNATFQIIYRACASVTGSNYGPVTNTITVGLGTTSLDVLVEASHLEFTNFHPSVAANFPGSWSRVQSASNNYPGQVVVKLPNIHHPVTFLGSGSDNAP